MDDELVLELTDASHLFVTPRVNPLSPSPAEVLGVAGVDYLLGQLHMDKQKQLARTLILLLPPGKAATTSSEELWRALHRQAEFRLQEQQRMLRNTYRSGWRATGIALILLALCLAFSSLFASDITDWIRPLIRKTFEYGFEIIGWVILWHPVDMLAFEPLAIRSRIAALKTLGSLTVVVRASNSIQTS
jgi:hypothetical protein